MKFAARCNARARRAASTCAVRAAKLAVKAQIRKLWQTNRATKGTVRRNASYKKIGPNLPRRELQSGDAVRPEGGLRSARKALLIKPAHDVCLWHKTDIKIVLNHLRCWG